MGKLKKDDVLGVGLLVFMLWGLAVGHVQHMENKVFKIKS